MRKLLATFTSLFTSAALLATSLRAEPAAPTAKVAPKAEARRLSFFAPSREPDRPRSDIFIPTVSFLLPGFDQWWEGHYGSAAAYSGVYLGGSLYAAAVARANDLNTSGERVDDDGKKIDTDDDESPLDQKDIAARKVIFGGLAAQGAAGMSAYHAFRTAASSRQAQGQYQFLAHDETPGDLFLAPFNFSYLKRSSTYVPLAVGAVLAGILLSSDPGEEMEPAKFTAADAFFTSAYSYNAGTHEEAMFRGWIMPVMYEYWGSEFWSNAAQATLFALAHLNTNATPLPQLLLGYHLGDVTQDDQWRLGEAVFIHVWWDVLAFATAYHYKRKPDEDVANNGQSIDGRKIVKQLTLWLPPLYYHF